MRRIVIAIAMLLQVVTACRVKAQIDPHFSQYYAYPLWLNPALTGVIDGDARVTANYKNQWATINNAYQTVALSADARPTDRVGIGLNILNESEGSAGFNYLTLYGSFSYAIYLSDDQYQQVHFGLQAGMINRNFDVNKQQFDDQYNPLTGFDPTIPSNEYFLTTGSTLFDAGSGVYYSNTDPGNQANLFGGFSVSHLTQPKDPFATEGISTKLPMRYTVHGGVRIKVDESFILTPHFIYMKQQNSYERDLGIYSEFKSDDNDGFIAGVMYRYQDAAIADVGYHFNNMIVGFSYDFNTSPLNQVTYYQGGVELSVSYIFHSHSMNREVVCPEF
jgi:type IX secretion system PorP/SprF family membrane protein